MLAACAVEPAPNTQTAQSKNAIIAGSDSDDSQNAVIGLIFYDPASGEVGECTGTMIAPNLVLTARHCVSRTDEGASCKPDGTPLGGGKVYEDRKATSLYVFVGKDRPKFQGGFKPNGQGSKIITDGSKTLCSHDVALVVLQAPIEDVPIAPIRLDNPPAADEEFTAVGWGITEKTQEPQVRQQRDLKVSMVGPAAEAVGISASEFETGEGICSGDSGGPALAKTGAVIGIVSRGGNGTQGSNPAAGCIGANTRNIFSFPAAFKDLILQGFEAAGAEPTPEPAATGGTCKADTECVSKACLTVGDKKQCAPSDCKTEGCPAGFTCKEADSKSTCEANPTTTKKDDSNGANQTTTSGCTVGSLRTPGRASASLVGLLCVGVAFGIRRRNRSAR